MATAKSVVFYLPEGFADWEGAFLMAELRDIRHPTRIVSDGGRVVESIGGLKVTTQGSIAEVRPEETQALILIGSDTWPDPNQNQTALAMALDFHKRGILLAAICAATVALGRTGLLDERRHTSNDLTMLKKLAPSYRGETHYSEDLTVADGNLITAPGIAAVDFTYAILTALGIYSETKRRKWYEMVKHGVRQPLEYWTST